jgi:hypothetical protein
MASKRLCKEDPANWIYVDGGIIPKVKIPNSGSEIFI